MEALVTNAQTQPSAGRGAARYTSPVYFPPRIHVWRRRTRVSNHALAIARGRFTAIVAGSLALIACPIVVQHRAHAQDAAPVDDRTPPTPMPKAKDLVVLFSGKPEEIAANWTTR